MEKEINLKRGWLLTKSDTGSKYMFTGDGIFIHGDKIEFATNNKNGTWLNVLYNNTYIGSFWIDSTVTIKEIKKLMEV